jgi:hypothetical protein
MLFAVYGSSTIMDHTEHQIVYTAWANYISEDFKDSWTVFTEKFLKHRTASGLKTH